MNAGKEPTYGLNRKKQMPFFRMFKRELFGMGGFGERAGAAGTAEDAESYGSKNEKEKIGLLVNLTQKVFLAVERELKLTGFWESIPARNKLKAEIQKSLLAPEFSAIPGLIKARKRIVSRIMEIAEKNNNIILFAK